MQWFHAEQYAFLSEWANRDIEPPYDCHDPVVSRCQVMPCVPGGKLTLRRASQHTHRPWLRSPVCECLPSSLIRNWSTLPGKTKREGEEELCFPSSRNPSILDFVLLVGKLLRCILAGPQGREGDVGGGGYLLSREHGVLWAGGVM